MDNYTVEKTAADATSKNKGISIDIAKILEQNPTAIAANIFYVVNGDEIDVKGMEILSSKPPTVS